MGFLREIMANLLIFLKDFSGSYGMAIILITITIKLILLPLGFKQEKAMRAQSKVQPKINELNDRYKNKKKGEEYNKELQAIYSEEGANPLLGCLPLLLQFPVFIALYSTLNNPEILNTGEKFLWFYLDKPDALFTFTNIPYFGYLTLNLLPILSALLQVLQQKLMTPPQGNSGSEMANSMQTTMLAMPLIMLLIFYKMPSGLNLYFLVNTFLGIMQSYLFLQLRKRDEGK